MTNQVRQVALIQQAAWPDKQRSLEETTRLGETLAGKPLDVLLLQELQQEMQQDMLWLHQIQLSLVQLQQLHVV